MTLEDFRQSLTRSDTPPAGVTPLLQALWHDAQGRLGPRAYAGSGGRDEGRRLGARLPASQGRRPRQRRLLVSPRVARPLHRHAGRRVDVDRLRAARTGLSFLCFLRCLDERRTLSRPRRQPPRRAAPPAPAQPVDPYAVSDTTASTAAATGGPERRRAAGAAAAVGHLESAADRRDRRGEDRGDEAGDRRCDQHRVRPGNSGEHLRARPDLRDQRRHRQPRRRPA